MLRPPAVRLTTHTKLFPRFSNPLSSSCIYATSSRITHSATRQRRNSSSKPSSSAPPNGNESSPVAPDANASTARKKGGFSKAGSRIKAKETVTGASSSSAISSMGRQEDTYAIPSVPSTQHLHLQDIHLASLFAFHRPISIENYLPQSVSNKRFSQIFTPKPSLPKIDGDNATTVAATVSDIIRGIEKQHNAKSVISFVLPKPTSDANVPDKSNNEPNYVSPAGTPVFVDIDAMLRSLPPFSVPPPPRRMSGKKARVPASKVAKMEEFFTPSSVGIIESFENEEQDAVYQTPTQPFLMRMYARQMQYLARNKDTFYAISVRRQRKLKMKKHKYKKLLKRTRNLRKRQDKL